MKILRQAQSRGLVLPARLQELQQGLRHQDTRSLR